MDPTGERSSHVGDPVGEGTGVLGGTGDTSSPSRVKEACRERLLGVSLTLEEVLGVGEGGTEEGVGEQ